jgi:hypothetical protein
MPIQSKKTNDIDAYIKAHPSCKRNKEKVVIAGKVDYLDSYMLPFSLLQYNYSNRRFALEINEKENEIGRKLDPNDKDDISIIKSLLLQDSNEAKKLKDDLIKIGEQTDVAAITHDGVVINGNRRMATLEELNTEQPTGKWDALWVVKLPLDISQKDLWKIEAGLQLSKDKVAEYGPVNDLLMIREGKTAGLNPSEIAAAMYGWKVEEVDGAIERLNLIDTFLDFMKAPNNYGIIKRFGLTEHFINIQKGILNKLKTEGASRKTISKKLEIAFAILRASIQKHEVMTHMEVRKLAKVLLDDDAFLIVSDNLPEKKDLRELPPELLIDNFSNAKDVLDNKQDRDKPVKLIDRAITALKAIDRNDPHFKANAVAINRKLIELNGVLGTLKSDLN